MIGTAITAKHDILAQQVHTYGTVDSKRLAGTAVVVVNWTSVSAEIVKARSTRARATQRMSNQDQYQSGPENSGDQRLDEVRHLRVGLAPKRYSRGLNILSFTMISAMKKMVKQISSTSGTRDSPRTLVLTQSPNGQNLWTPCSCIIEETVPTCTLAGSDSTLTEPPATLDCLDPCLR